MTATEIRHIDNDSFKELCDLYAAMGTHLEVPLSYMSSICTLCDDVINRPNFLSLGIYKYGVLSGFITGYALSSKTFYLSGLYSKSNNNKDVRSLISKSFYIIQNNGYTAIEADCNEQVKPFLKWYKFSVMMTRYRKEL